MWFGSALNSELWTRCHVIVVASSFCFGYFLGSSLCYEVPTHMQKPITHAHFCPAALTHARLLQVRLRWELRNKLGDLALGLCSMSAPLQAPAALSGTLLPQRVSLGLGNPDMWTQQVDPRPPWGGTYTTAKSYNAM